METSRVLHCFMAEQVRTCPGPVLDQVANCNKGIWELCFVRLSYKKAGKATRLKLQKLTPFFSENNRFHLENQASDN